MRSVGIRALKQNASAVVADAAAGETVIITDRGRPVAQLIPLPSGHLDTLIAAGRARPAKRSLRTLGTPPRRERHQPPLSATLTETRGTERY